MSKCGSLVLNCGSLLLVAACSAAPQAASTQADVDAINLVREREMTAFNGGQADSLAALWTSDGSFMPPHSPLATGSEGVRAWAHGVAAQLVVNGSYTASDITVAGDWAIERYTAQLTLTPKAGGAPVTEAIKGIHIYRRQADGTWRIAQDVWNTDAP